MSEHTKEPWTYGHVGDDFWIGDNSDGLNNLARVYWDMGEIPEGRANARRIVACVNACSGIKTEDLEALSGTAILEIANTQSATLKRQRDMLLDALKEIAARNEIQSWFNLDQARAAIAAVEEEK